MRLPLLQGVGCVTCLLILSVGPDRRLHSSSRWQQWLWCTSGVHASGQQRQLGLQPVQAARGYPTTISQFTSLCNSFSQHFVCGMVQTMGTFLCQPPRAIGATPAEPSTCQVTECVHPAEAWAIREKREQLKGEALQQKLTLSRQAEKRVEALRGSLRSRPANHK